MMIRTQQEGDLKQLSLFSEDEVGPPERQRKIDCQPVKIEGKQVNVQPPYIQLVLPGFEEEKEKRG